MSDILDLHELKQLLITRLDSSYDFHGRMRRLFESKLVSTIVAKKSTDLLRLENRNLTEPEDIEKAIQLGEFIRNGTYCAPQQTSYKTPI